MTVTDSALVCTPEEFLAATPQKRAVYVRDQILLTPELYDQTVWGRETSCGTVCCVAGWTAMLAGDRFAFPSRVTYDNHEPVLERVHVNGRITHVARRAAELLAIINDDAWCQLDGGLFDPDLQQEAVISMLDDLAAR